MYKISFVLPLVALMGFLALGGLSERRAAPDMILRAAPSVSVSLLPKVAE